MDPNPAWSSVCLARRMRRKLVASRKTPMLGGWHYSPAGEERAVIARASLQPLYPEDTPDEGAMVKGRLNKVSVGTSGQMIIDDALTCCTQDNYLHFQHVPSLMNAISRFFVQLALQMRST